MAAGIFILLFWLGFERFDVRRGLISVSKKEFNEMLRLR
jgi:hypothetical protein